MCADMDRVTRAGGASLGFQIPLGVTNYQFDFGGEQSLSGNTLFSDVGGWKPTPLPAEPSA
jgi:hypothetical protein